MMLPQVVENPTVIDVLDSAPQTYNTAFEEWTQGSGVSESITQLNVEPLTERGVVAKKAQQEKVF